MGYHNSFTIHRHSQNHILFQLRIAIICQYLIANWNHDNQTYGFPQVFLPLSERFSTGVLYCWLHVLPNVSYPYSNRRASPLMIAYTAMYIQTTEATETSQTDRISVKNKVSQYNIGQHNISQYKVSQHNISQYKVGQYNISQYHIDQHNIGQHNICQYNINHITLP